MKRNLTGHAGDITINGLLEPNARALQLLRSAGSANPDKLTFEIENVGRRNADMQDSQVRNFLRNDLVELTDNNQRLMFRGRLVAVSPKVSSDSESRQYEARLDDHMFGFPVDTRWIASRQAGSSSDAEAFTRGLAADHRDIVFNPVIKGRSVPNMFSLVVAAGQFKNARPFVDPESFPENHLHSYISLFSSVKSPPASALGAEYWNLPQCINYLCWSLNPFEKYVKNPTLLGLVALLGVDQTIVRDREIKYGDHLPKALDQLLNGYGYSWYVSFDNNEPRITIYNRSGVAPEPIELQLPKIGANNGVQPAVAETALRYDISDKSSNAVFVIGGAKVYESTFELRPAWENKWDADLDPRKFTPNFVDPATGKVPWDNDPQFRRAWRDWVLNEGGDYFRKEKWDNDLTRHGFLAFRPRRLRFLPTLTRNADGSPIGEANGTVIEYYDPFVKKWKNVRGEGGLDDSQNVQVLENEAGIRFDSPNGPPGQLMAIASVYGLANTRIRITASLESDDFVEAASPGNPSHLVDQRTHVIRLPRKYQYKEVLKTSKFKNLVANGVLQSGQVDDEPGALRLSQHVVGNWNKGNMTGEIELFGVQWLVPIGGRIAGIQPRNIQLNTAAGANNTSHPVVTGIRWDFQRQTMRLSLDTHFSPVRPQ